MSWYQIVGPGVENQRSVANVSQILTLDRARLTDHVGRLGAAELDAILAGIDVVLNR